MSNDSLINDDANCASLPADDNHGAHRHHYNEVVSLVRNTDGPCTTECDSRDWSARSKQENLSVLKLEPQDVCRIGSVW